MSSQEITTDFDQYREFPRLATLLGIVSVLGALAVGTVAYHHSVKMAERHYQAVYLMKARTLAAQARIHTEVSDSALIRVIDVHWANLGVKAPDEYLRIVDDESRIIFHTKNPDLLDRCVGDDVLVPVGDDNAPVSVGTLVSAPEYQAIGHYGHVGEQREIVAVFVIPQRKWILSVHRSRADVAAEVRSDLLGPIVGFGMICGLLMPLSFALLYCTFWLSHRRRRRAEKDLLQAYTRLSESLERLKKAQKQMVQQERMKAMGQMASGIAHDFSNALMPIAGLIEMTLVDQSILDDKKATVAMLQKMAVSASDAKAVVGRLREFYKPGEDLRFSTLNINSIVQSTIVLTQSRWQAETQAKGCPVKLVPELENVPSVAGSEFQIREALTNLIFNAVDAMPEGGIIEIRTRNIGDRAVIEVSDTGEGMDEHTLQHCFDAFFTTKGERGTGMGLRMVRDIVDRHNGTIDVKSLQGKGTTFSITLPAGTVDSEETPARVMPDLGVLRVLVADDHVGAQDLLRQYLSADNHVVDAVDTGSEAIQLLKRRTYDIVITDRAMPDMNGDMVAVAAKGKSPPIPVIMLTGFGDIMIERREYPPGVDMIMPKPVGYRQLQLAMARVVGKE